MRKQDNPFNKVFKIGSMKTMTDMGYPELEDTKDSDISFDKISFNEGPSFKEAMLDFEGGAEKNKLYNDGYQPPSMFDGWDRIKEETVSQFQAGADLELRGREYGKDSSLKQIPGDIDRIGGGAQAILAPVTAILKESARGYYELAKLAANTTSGLELREGIKNFFNTEAVKEVTGTFREGGELPITPYLAKGVSSTAEFIEETPGVTGLSRLFMVATQLESLGLGSSKATIGNLAEEYAKNKKGKVTKLGNELGRITNIPKDIVKEGKKFDITSPPRQTQELMKTIAESDVKIKSFDDLLPEIQKDKISAITEKKKLFSEIDKPAIFGDKNALELANIVKNDVKNHPGLADDVEFLDDIINKLENNSATIEEIDRLKTVGDRYERIFKKGGDAKDSIKASSIENLRKEVKKLVEAEVPEVTDINNKIGGLISAEDWVADTAAAVTKSKDPMGALRATGAKLPWASRWFAKSGVKEAAILEKELAKIVKKVKKADLGVFESTSKEVDKFLKPSKKIIIQNRANAWIRNMEEKAKTATDKEAQIVFDEIKRKQVYNAFLADELQKEGYTLGDDFIFKKGEGTLESPVKPKVIEQPAAKPQLKLKPGEQGLTKAGTASKSLVEQAKSFKSAEDYISKRLGLAKTVTGKQDILIGNSFILKGKKSQLQLSLNENPKEIILTSISAKELSDLTKVSKGTGIGKSVINELKNYADATGKKFIIADTTNPAMKFWDKISFLERDFGIKMQDEKGFFNVPNSYSYTPKPFRLGGR